MEPSLTNGAAPSDFRVQAQPASIYDGQGYCNPQRQVTVGNANPSVACGDSSPFRRAQTVEKPPESSRGPQPFRTFNRAQRRVRWARDAFCVGKSHFPEKIAFPCRLRAGKSHFPEQKSFPCSFCARKSLRFQQKLVRVVGRLKTLWVFRFRPWRNCRWLKSKI